VLDQLADMRCPLGLAWLELPVMEPIDLTEEFVREGPDPWAELLLDVCLQDLLQFAAGAEITSRSSLRAAGLLS